MNKRKYRFFVICCLVLDLLVILISGYRYLDRKIPDEIQIPGDRKTEDVTEVLSTPLVTFEEAVTVSQDGGYILPCKLLGYIPFKEIKVTPADDQEVYVSGSTIGIYMQTEGVLVIDTGEIQNRNGETEEPARNIIRQGDYIISFNGEKISTKRELIDDISELDGSEVTLEISRKGESIPVSVTPVKDKNGEYKVGLWVRDSAAGVGTITFYWDKMQTFAALGHAITDIDTGEIVQISSGEIDDVSIVSLVKGVKEKPGKIQGTILQNSIIGSIYKNTQYGIYGVVKNIENLDIDYSRKMYVATRQEINLGEATILSNIDGELKEYKIEIQKTYLNNNYDNKSMVIKVTDEELLNKTGGIIQGMSGSPIIQNGKFIGAITHVFVKDPSIGYAVFADRMISEME